MRRQEIAVRYLVSPFETQVDSGYAGVAEAFRMAAQALERCRKKTAFPYLHLPENFLYRHAIELYLKAMIITVHRARRLPYGSYRWNGAPYVPFGSRWTPLDRVHSVAALYMCVKQAVRRSRKAAAELTRHGWAEGLARLDVWMNVIDRSDDSATLFRYPTTKHVRQDRLKSSWEFVTPAAALREAMLRRGGGLINLSSRGPKRSYRYVQMPQRRLSLALRRSAHTLAAFHDRLRLGLGR